MTAGKIEPRDNNRTGVRWTRLHWIGLAAALAWAAQSVDAVARAEGLYTTSTRWRLGGQLLPWLPLVLVALAGLTFWPPVRRVLEGWAARTAPGSRGQLARAAGWAFAGVCGALFAALVYGTGAYGKFFTDYSVRLFLAWALAWLASEALAALGGLARGKAFLAAALGLGVIYQAAGFLPLFTNYPFSMDWSETSWFYYASFFFSERLYGVKLPWPPLDFLRHLLQSVPFLWPGAPLAAHRIWQVCLWLLATGAAAWALAKRQPARRGWVAAWAGLFLLIGPVYYFLQFAVALVWAGFNPRRPWRSLAVILLASALGGLSRFNWSVVPAMLGLLIYFLEEEPGNRSIWRYYRWPVVWGALGVAAGGAMVCLLGVSVQGGLRNIAGSSLSSALLWERLWPNPTFGWGIVPGMLAVTAALWAAILWGTPWREGGWRRWLPAVGLLLVLLAGGLAVSVKIGGGNNLHNLDAFFVLLLTWAAAAFSRLELLARPGKARAALAGALLLTPVLWLMQQGGAFRAYDLAAAQTELKQLQTVVSDYAGEGKPVLFIWQRHLLTFGLMPGVALVPEYELENLMEMSMSNDQNALAKFHASLNAHEYALIVSDWQNPEPKYEEGAFSAEHNAWYEAVSRPLLAAYQPLLFLPQSGVQVYAPAP